MPRRPRLHIADYPHHIVQRGHNRAACFFAEYKSSLIQTDTYLLRCQRYIELNPVRADMVRDPGAYPWSSYRANGLGASDPLLSPHTLYLELGDSPKARQAAYRELFRTELDEAALSELRLAVQQSQPVGCKRFLQQVEQMTGQRREVRPRGRPRLEPDGPDVLPGQMEWGL